MTLALLAALALAEPVSEAQADYDQRFVGLGEGVTYIERTGEVVSTWSYPYRGVDEVPLKGREFFDYVGYTELGDAYRRRRTAKVVLVLGGSGLLVAALGQYLAAPAGDRTAAALGIAGLGVAAVGMFVQPWPVSDQDTRRLVDEHNTRLKRELGLSAWLGPDSGGLELALAW